MEITRFFAKFGVRVDPKELKKVDAALLAMEKKLRRWTARQKALPPLRLSNFDVNDAKLRVVLGNALDRASGRVTFQIRKFDVDDRALRAAMMRASRRNAAMMGAPVGGGGAGGAASAGFMASSLGMHGSQGRPGRVSAGPGGGRSGNMMLGSAVGMMGMRPYGPLAAGGVLGYMGFQGLSAINRRNQEIVSARIASRSVASMYGEPDEQGDKSFNWLRKQGNRLGFSYLDATQGYNNFLANAMGAGMTMGESQDIFKGFTEFSKVQGVPKAKMKLVNQALGQMMG